MVLTHETSTYVTPAVQQILEANPHRISGRVLDLSEASRQQVSTLLELVTPRLHVHGHMHVYDRVTVTLPDANYETEILSLAADAERGSLAFLQLPELHVAPWMRQGPRQT